MAITICSDVLKLARVTCGMLLGARHYAEFSFTSAHLSRSYYSHFTDKENNLSVVDKWQNMDSNLPVFINKCLP